MPHGKVITLFISCAVLLFASTTTAQTTVERFERQLEKIQRQTRAEANHSIPLEQRVLLDYGGFLTLSFWAIDDPGQNTHILRQFDETSYLRLNIDGAHEFYLRTRSSYRDFNSGDDFDGQGDDFVETTLDRGFYRFDLRRYLAAYDDQTIEANLTIKGGRQLVHWANGLTISEEIDGGLITGTLGPMTLQAVAGLTRDSITDIDSSRPKFDHETHRGFYGAMFSYQLSENHTPYIYGLVQEDNNNGDNRAVLAGIPIRFGYDSYYIGVGSTGTIADNIAYGVEFTYQGGETFSSSFNRNTGVATPQTVDDIEAWALDIYVDYLLGDPNRTRLSAELLLASGDDDRLHTTNTFGGNAANTNDSAFNAFGLIDTGLAFSTNTSNLVMVRGGVTMLPLPNSPWFSRLQVGTNLFVFNKLDSDGPIDEPTSNSGYLGFEADFLANWRITSDLSLAMRYGVFFPGEAILTDHDTRHFFFTGLTFAY